jgi:hypothetical protein
MLEWGKEPSYYFGSDDAEYAWIEGSRDFHWAVNEGALAVFDNEYDRWMQLSTAVRSQTETKELARRLQDVLDGRDAVSEAVERIVEALDEAREDSFSRESLTSLDFWNRGQTKGLDEAIALLRSRDWSKGEG